MKKGRRFTALLLAVMMLLSFAPANVKANDKAATYVLSGIPDHVTVKVNGTKQNVSGGQLNVEASSSVTVTPDDGYVFRYFYVNSAVSTHPDTAYVTLSAPDIWGDGSGYQMLLDADATAYGTTIPEAGGLTESGDASAEVYAEFEYKIPENADGSLTTSNIIINGSETVEIPAGIYDYVITNPTPGDRVWVASDNGDAPGRCDDFEFEAGVDYVFTLGVYGTNDGVSLLSGVGIVPVYAQDSSYTFTMPDADAVIDAEVAEKPQNFWDFEDSIQLDDWYLYDADGDGKNWGWISTNTNPHSGSSNMTSASYDSSGALTPDNWLIVEAVVPDNDPELSFWIAGQDPSWAAEHLLPYIAVGNVETVAMDDFIPLADDDLVATGEYVEYTYDLSAYAGQEVLIAFRHYNVTDMFRINLDDVWVKGTYEEFPEVLVDVEKMTTDGIYLNFSTEAEVDHFEIYRTDNGEDYEGFSTDGTSYLDEVGKTMGTIYTYTVLGVDADNNIIAGSEDVDVLYNPFVDVDPADEPNFTYVCWAYNNDVVGGARNKNTGLDYFKLDNNCTRAQFCIMFYKLYDNPSVTLPKPLPFVDIDDQTSNTKKAIIWLYNEGVVSGSKNDNTIFMPKGNIKRVQLAIMFYKKAGLPSVDITDLHFTDIASQTSNTKKAIVWCYQNHLIDSIEGDKFSPNTEATRALLTEMLYNFNVFAGVKPVSAAEEKLGARLTQLNALRPILVDSARNAKQADVKSR